MTSPHFPVYLADAAASNTPDQVPDSASQGFCDLGERFNGDLLLPPFNIPDVVARHTRLLGQFLLAVMQFPPFGANGISQHPIDFA